MYRESFLGSPSVSVAPILALGRFGIIAIAQVKSLEKRWEKHREETSPYRNGKLDPTVICTVLPCDNSST